jgi:signal transduction histidine kinase
MNAMNRFRPVYKQHLLALGTALLAVLSVQAKERVPSAAELTQQLESIHTELNQLADYTMRTGVGNLGWLSEKHPSSDHIEWVQIDFKKESIIDQIVLAPVIWVDTQAGPIADGFPVELRIIAGTKQNPNGSVIATYRETDQTVPRIAPLILSLSPTSASWIRVEATQLAPWAWEKDVYIFQLSEVLIFSGHKNVALHRPVKTSSARKNRVTKAMNTEALVDGYMPYLMDAAIGERSDPYLSFYRSAITPSFTIDLGEECIIDSMNLHAADLRENIPRIHHADYAAPKHLIIEGARTPDFSDATLLADYQREQIYDTGPITMLHFPPTPARYIRLTVQDGYSAPEAADTWRCVGFAEIEIGSEGNNVAVGRPVHLNIEAPKPTQGKLSALTDGLNHYGAILPLREWMNQLARRHELETQRPVIEQQLALSHLRQEKNLLLLKALAALLATGIALAIAIERLLHRKTIKRLKERFAADLHDEIGANLHTIGLLSDMVEEFKQVPENISEYIQRIRAVTARTGTAVRYVSGLHESSELFSDLKTDMQRAADRIVTKQKHTFFIDGESFIPGLKQKTRIHLFLFFKECLINISRHSGATELTTELTLTSQKIILSVTDNGKGLPEGTNNLPISLQRRAKLLRAKLSQEIPDGGGTRMILRLRRRRSFAASQTSQRRTS